MRNMLAFLAAVTLTFLGAGWYLDWFKVRSTPAPAGKRSLSIDINTTKIGEDLHRGEQKIQGMLDANQKGAGENSVPAKPTPSTGIPSKPGKPDATTVPPSGGALPLHINSPTP